MKTPFLALVRWLRAGMTTRFHTHRQTKLQDVAQHSWGVAIIACYLWPDCRAEFLKALLMHDMGEAISCDAPAPVKWRWPEFRKQLNLVESEAADMLLLPALGLTDEEVQRLRWCDLLECLLHSWQQRRLGNLEYVAPFRALAEVLYSDVGLDPRVKEVLVAAESDMKSLGNYNMEPELESHFP